MAEQELKKKPIKQRQITEEEFRQEIAKEFDKRDEEQIEKEILGDIVSNYCYEYQSGSRTIRNLSLAGIKEIARQMGSIRSEKPEIEDFQSKYRVKTKVIDLVRRLSFWGVAEQSKKMKLKGGVLVDDEYALQKAVSKSLRNGLVSLIPQDLKAKMIEKFVEERKKHKEDAKSFM